MFMVGMEEGLFSSEMSFEDPNRLEEERSRANVALPTASHFRQELPARRANPGWPICAPRDVW